MRPRVFFDSRNIWKRLEACRTVARAYGWRHDDIVEFTRNIVDAFTYEEAMTIIERRFETTKQG